MLNDIKFTMIIFMKFNLYVTFVDYSDINHEVRIL